MHELSIAENIIEIVRENLPSGNRRKLRSIKVRIGELAGIVPESLDFCFTAITKGTPIEDAKLNIEKVGIAARCTHCGNEFPIEGLVFRCPACESAGIRVTSGNELEVVEIEVEDPDVSEA